MDGNGRWACGKGLPRVAGHREGVNTVRKITRYCGKLGIEVLTLYTFSAENWQRPETEVSALMKLFVQSLRSEINDLMANNVRFSFIGNSNQLPENVSRELNSGMEQTKNNTGLILNLAFNYGSRQEIISAVVAIAEKIRNDLISVEDITEELIVDHLYTRGLPDPDLLIRTGGELRLSNFLLWQVAYSELYLTDTFWPDFSENELDIALKEYQSRDRRYGRISNQIK